MKELLIIVRQSSSLRQITESEVVEALSDSDQKVERLHLEVSTTHLADAVDQGDWRGHDAFLREWAAKIRNAAEHRGNSEVHYFGLAEVPHIVSLGAHFG